MRRRPHHSPIMVLRIVRNSSEGDREVFSYDYQLYNPVVVDSEVQTDTSLGASDAETQTDPLPPPYPPPEPATWLRSEEGGWLVGSRWSHQNRWGDPVHNSNPGVNPYFPYVHRAHRVHPLKKCVLLLRRRPPVEEASSYIGEHTIPNQYQY